MQVSITGPKPCNNGRGEIGLSLGLSPDFYYWSIQQNRCEINGDDCCVVRSAAVSRARIPYAFRPCLRPSTMVSKRVFAATTIAVGSGSLVHAVVTWPLPATLSLFGGGVIVAFLAEAVAVNLGWLEHNIGPKAVGVPLYLLFGWPGTIYVAFRVALLLTDGWGAVVVAAVLATTYDVFTDHMGVEEGHWTYTDDLPGPRYRTVPWWNYVGWFLISCLTAAFAVPSL
jgi:hypothetical protein